MTLWKELITIPNQVFKDDFVLKLAEGVERKQKTVDNYVVTPQIADAYRKALTMIQSAVQDKKSVASYLHGSFGSGKSHFMAVLNLILEGYPPALKLDHIEQVVAEFDWVQSSDFLMVPYHFMDSKTMESAILGGYVNYIEKHHPDAPTPGVYVSGSILQNADDLRASIGDDGFFKALNKGSSSNSGWGALTAAWNAETYHAARNAPPGSEQLERLVGDVVSRVLPALKTTASTSGEGFVALDEGLATISRHVNRLEVPGKAGKTYDGLILFLDELVLWLASQRGDVQFLNREGQKLAKLIEAQDVDRPVPIISFVARQRDLREFLGDHSGEAQDSVWQQLQYWDRGIDMITLGDHNLPVIVEQRLLKPHGAPQREQIREAFRVNVEQRMKSSDRETLIGTQADIERFRQVYPFSPALIDALIALSALLHRERTALRLLLMLLVDRRDELELGQVIPIGDLWDVIADQTEPFSDMIRNTFQSAQKLYTTRLRPMLLEENRLTEESDPMSNSNFRSDDRIIKTLLISTLIPNIEVFRSLTAHNLVALNHGTVKAPTRGGEVSNLLIKLRRWQTRYSEIRVSQDNPSNPTISLQLSNVDIDGLVQSVNNVDNDGNRRRVVQELLFSLLKIDLGTAGPWTPYKFEWRGAMRQFRVAYRNVRTMPLDEFEAGEHFQLVIDYPFDEEGKTPADDSAKLNEYLEKHEDGTNTIAWLPSFLSARGTERLGRLVRIENLLTRLQDHVKHIAVADRPIVRNALEGQRDALRGELTLALEVCYGIRNDPENPNVDYGTKPARRLVSLRQDYAPRIPGGYELDATLREIAASALKEVFPKAPKFPDETVTKGRVQKIADELLNWIEDGEVSGYVESKPMREELAKWAQPLGLGQMGDNRFAPSTWWRDRIRHAGLGVTTPLDVAALRELLDPPDDRSGIPTMLQDLVIVVFAAQEDLVFRVNGVPLQPRIGELNNDALLVPRKMPTEEDWVVASKVALDVFGIKVGHLRIARNVERLFVDLTEAAKRHLIVKELGEQLVVAGEALGLERAEVVESPRHETTQLLVQLFAALKQDAADVVTSIANMSLSANQVGAMNLTLQRSEQLYRWLSTDWLVFKKLVAREEDSPGVAALLREAREVLTSNETVEPLDQFVDLRRRAIEVLADPGPIPVPDPVPPVPSPDEAAERSFSATTTEELLRQLTAYLKSDEAQTLLDGGAQVRISFVRGQA